MFRSALVSISVVALAGCGAPTTCPAVLYGGSLTVRLADGWAGAAPRSVTVRCPDEVECGSIAPGDLTVLPQPEEVPVPSLGSPPPPSPELPPSPEPSPEISGTTQDLDDGEATYVLHGGPRDELVVTVHGADGVLLERTVTPDWVRVGGSAECGGPTEAEVVVPAP